MAADKFLSQQSGSVTEKSAADVSAGAGDAGRLVALDDDGLIDETMLPAAAVEVEVYAQVTAPGTEAAGHVHLWFETDGAGDVQNIKLWTP